MYDCCSHYNVITAYSENSEQLLLTFYQENIFSPPQLLVEKICGHLALSRTVASFLSDIS